MITQETLPNPSVERLSPEVSSNPMVTPIDPFSEAPVVPNPAAQPFDAFPHRIRRPEFRFYHPSKNGTGSALSLDLVPATDQEEGCVFVSLAPQKTLAAAATASQTKQFATFDWKNKLVVKLSSMEVASLLLVFHGLATAAGPAGKGLFHNTATNTTVIGLSAVADPVPGYSFDISRKLLSTGEISRVRIFLNQTEGFALRLVLSESMPSLVFGANHP